MGFLLAKDVRILKIRQHLYGEGYSSVQSIAEAVGASVATVRRDLHDLEESGAIVRDHGGARISDRIGVEVAFELREQQNLAEKRAIAGAAYNLITPNSSIFLDAGTTVYQLARRLRLDPMPLEVFSNCVTIAQALLNVPGITVTLLGGRLRPKNASMVGNLTENALDSLWFDQLYLGGGAIADDACIYSLDSDEARINAKMLTRATEAHLLADASKFGQRQTYRVAELSKNINVVTDSNISEEWAKRLAKMGCNPLVVDLIAAPIKLAEST